ncbi:MAG: carboxyl transferase domain-containing protein [Solirubrobacteraceae bacterium]
MTPLPLSDALATSSLPDRERGVGALLEVERPAPNDALKRVLELLDSASFIPVREAVGDGVIAGTGRIAGRLVCVWAQDPRHRGGSLGVAGGETIARTIIRASRSGVPVIGIPDSAGARLQEGVGALAAYAAIFREQALARVPQITLVGGACAGGAAYSPALGDFVVMGGPNARLFLTGPTVIEQVTGEQTTAEALGGARVHGANGVAQLVVGDERSWGGLLQDLLGYLPSIFGGDLPLLPALAPPPGDPAGCLPARTRFVYDVRDVIRAIVDADSQLELSQRWAPNMVTTFVRLDGRPVGILANQPRYRGGTIDSGASQKGAWFVGLCDRLGLPMVVLVDTPGFLPGVQQERAGVIRHGAALLRAFATAAVPRITLTLRQAFGGAHIVMNSRDLGADLTLAWPGAEIGIMGAPQAVALIDRAAITAGSDPIELAERYAQRLQVDAAAAGGFIDEIVAPAQTRQRLIDGLEFRA